MSILLAVVVASILAAVYPVVLYPAVIVLLSRLTPRPWLRGLVTEPVVHVITVYNEERRITAKLENTTSLAAPTGGVRTLVVGDGSSDRTASIVAAHAGSGIEWLGFARRGKEWAQIDAIAATTEPIIVFSDASALLEADALCRIVESFADSSVVAVSGTDRVADQGGRVGEDLYVRYEMAVREAESRVGSLVGLSGCFFAVRREIATQFIPDVPSDLGAALIAIRDGRRAVADDRAVARYDAAGGTGQEFARKRRTALRGLRCLLAYRAAMSPRRPLLAWQVVSHKLLRFAIPWLLIVAIVASVVSAWRGEAWAVAGLLSSITLVAIAISSLRVRVLRSVAPFRAAGFFLLSSAAVLCAWIDVGRGRAQPIWEPTRRPGPTP